MACPPIGMAQLSSVVLTAEVGVTLRNGEELGYFQFGGSDFVMAASARAMCSARARWECIRSKGAASAPRIP